MNVLKESIRHGNTKLLCRKRELNDEHFLQGLVIMALGYVGLFKVAAENRVEDINLRRITLILCSSKEPGLRAVNELR